MASGICRVQVDAHACKDACTRDGCTCLHTGTCLYAHVCMHMSVHMSVPKTSAVRALLAPSSWAWPSPAWPRSSSSSSGDTTSKLNHPFFSAAPIAGDTRLLTCLAFGALEHKKRNGIALALARGATVVMGRTRAGRGFVETHKKANY